MAMPNLLSNGSHISFIYQTYQTCLFFPRLFHAKMLGEVFTPVTTNTLFAISTWTGSHWSSSQLATGRFDPRLVGEYRKPIIHIPHMSIWFYMILYDSICTFIHGLFLHMNISLIDTCPDQASRLSAAPNFLFCPSAQAAKLQDMEASKNAMEQLCSKLRDQLDQVGSWWQETGEAMWNPERAYFVKLYRSYVIVDNATDSSMCFFVSSDFSHLRKSSMAFYENRSPLK